jgi:hypothetical protein
VTETLLPIDPLFVVAVAVLQGPWGRGDDRRDTMLASRLTEHVRDEIDLEVSRANMQQVADDFAGDPGLHPNMNFEMATKFLTHALVVASPEGRVAASDVQRLLLHALTGLGAEALWSAIHTGIWPVHVDRGVLTLLGLTNPDLVTILTADSVTSA